MKSLFVIALLCCCIELSYQRYLLKNDINGQQQHDIVKRDLADDFFDKIVEKGKSFFVDDDEAKHDSDATVNHDNNGDNSKVDNNEHKHNSDATVNHDSNDKFDNDRRDDNTNTHSNIDNTDHSSSSGSKSHVSTKSDDNDDFISEETLKRILAKVVAYASNDSDNQEHSDGSNTDSVKHDGSDSDSDAMLDKLGNILIKEGIKIGVAELASSFLGKK
uniref:Uncharacterized protein n=1 Tax=Panagrolaimus davidi TaxID=227884 RepID=A0A914Q2T9_9BILA